MAPLLDPHSVEFLSGEKRANLEFFCSLLCGRLGTQALLDDAREELFFHLSWHTGIEAAAEPKAEASIEPASSQNFARGHILGSR